jgi:hypothetical protein
MAPERKPMRRSATRRRLVDRGATKAHIGVEGAPTVRLLGDYGVAQLQVVGAMRRTTLSSNGERSAVTHIWPSGPAVMS